VVEGGRGEWADDWAGPGGTDYQMADNAIKSLLAHSKNESGDCQPLASHLAQTADMAARFAHRFGAGDVARLAALTHDLGKASERFQRYLAGIGDSGGDHKAAGVIQASNLGLSGPISFAIAGHHGGLPRFADVKSTLGAGLAPELGPRLGELLSHLSLPSNAAYPAFSASALETELFTRMLFSALVDADHLDTEAHFNPEKGEKRGGYPSLADLWSRFDETYRSRFSRKPQGVLNSIRQDVHGRCLSAAEAEPGAFSLTVPTGGGKTLASLGFALRHAQKWGLDRVSVVIPYTSIIEQTADVFREFLGPDAVLEHHSATQDEPGADCVLPRELASENWDAPIYGLYRGYGFYNPYLAQDTGFAGEDLAVFWDALERMWDLDRSAARGLMACRGLAVFSHASALGNAPAHKLFDLVKVGKKDTVGAPRHFSDYEITLDRDRVPANVTASVLVEW